MEASILSPNQNLYGDLHNLIHVLIGLCHDPDARNLETFSTIGDPATAMRDPIFYRLHAFVDDVFQEHKATLPPYETNRLNYNGITVRGVDVVSQGVPRNEFKTFWKKDDVDLSRGIDFTPRGNVFARFTHLQHTEFTYRIQVENNTNSDKIGTVRIFLAPKFDERGVNMVFRDQRLLFIELDKFTTTLKPKTNTIERKSTDSSWWYTTGGIQLLWLWMATSYAHSQGHSRRLLMPTFVMISNYDDDKINQSTEGACADAASYCGIRDKLYPDKRSMGYPFDRVPRSGVNTLQDFLTPNMFVQNVTIRFSGQTFDVQGADITNALT
ncbi:hypothetical protein L9F63_027445 [Diploptera punctata]|uniref:Tyrosinase copper-binding domain-containing protein n=1 Tax=Diploptera punctata TaxID=6984 RepID=A0AAD8A8R6_DIPPU|nr:hypothetical protein L9F63_027445 [Diploptera punctata]